MFNNVYKTEKEIVLDSAKFTLLRQHMYFSSQEAGFNCKDLSLIKLCFFE